MFGKRTEDSTSATHFRSERISWVNGNYFFTTREGTLEGPFFTREEAEHQIARYVSRMTQAAELRKRAG
ncbi:DUF6316 family protein [Pseudomonas asuensis]|jgi:hypothetical protein|uniref:DUF6316 domain-containing protein n=1 Tax=Pseudomonas asuensis TaxID=1825787 RepID=A0ABQ2H2L3_9PSED|nr:DUF6316 family protein [Pseudomonas asuensis]GGM24942.1 hypothetical protein GCM10009425_39710 [Pseudomonas asuensis]